MNVALATILLMMSTHFASPPNPSTTPASPVNMKLTPSELRELAHEYYRWYYEEFPVVASDAGLHDGDSQLAGYSAAKREGRVRKATELLGRLSAAESSLT